MRQLTGRHRHPHADDVVQSETLTVVERIDIIRETYPDPATYARVRARHAGIDHDRRQAAQRGHGSRMRYHDDGTVSWARDVVSGDAPDPTTGMTIFDTLVADDADPAEIVGQRETLRHLVETVVMPLSPRARQVVMLVKVHHFTVTEAAELIGIDRASASRLLHRSLATLYETLEHLAHDRSVG